MAEKIYIADFETTGETQTEIDGQARVWSACCVDMYTEEVKVLSTNVNDFLNFLAKDDTYHSTKTVYFHNLKFDGQFIISKLFENGFTHTTTKYMQDKSFSTVVSDTGVFYEIKICFKNYGTRSNKVTIHDSYKKLPFSADRIAKAFKVGTVKGSIDYNLYRDFPYTMTEEEKEYIITDCLIIARALRVQFQQGLSKMTIGGDALNSFKNMINKSNYNYLFPDLDLKIDRDLRQAYKGGWVYLKPEYAEVELKNVLALDVNSLYPFAMREFPVPHGSPTYYKGKYKNDKEYPLYIQHIRVDMVLKKDHLPTIQIKNNWRFSSTEYITSTEGEGVELFLTNVDLELMLDHYNIIDIEYLEGFKFQQVKGLFNEYIDYWYNIKATSTGALREIAKLMLNNLYGKFGTNPLRTNVFPLWDEETGMTRWIRGEEEEGKGGYVACASFITAWARNHTIRSAQKLYKHFVYSDTDSIKLVGITMEEVSKIIHVDNDIIGAFKDEGTSTRAKFLRPKTYVSDIDGNINITCAGLPKDARSLITFEDFNTSLQVDGKLMQKRVKGGVVLKSTTFKFNKQVMRT